MAELEVTIGGRNFRVACEDGQEPFLQSAAALLDGEAAQLADQLGRMPADRMLLMAGLLLADKTAGLQDELRRVQEELEEYKAMPTPEPERIEIPMIPPHVVEALAELAAQAEAVADAVEAKSTGT